MSRSPILRAGVCVASLVALIGISAWHGALSHGHLRCDGVETDRCSALGADPGLEAAGAQAPCPLCLASGQARTLLQIRTLEAAPGPLAVASPTLPAAPSLPAATRRGPSGPRAPPLPL